MYNSSLKKKKKINILSTMNAHDLSILCIWQYGKITTDTNNFVGYIDVVYSRCHTHIDKQNTECN